MRLNTKGRYAVTAMLDLALHRHEMPVILANISQRQGIPLSYLEQLFAKLRRHRLVEALRGPLGGYCLTVDPEQISIARIIYSVGEGMDATQCKGQQNCSQQRRCLTHDLWMGLNQHIANYLNNTTLADLVQRDTVRHVAQRQNALNAPPPPPTPVAAHAEDA